MLKVGSRPRHWLIYLSQSDPLRRMHLVHDVLLNKWLEVLGELRIWVLVQLLVQESCWIIIERKRVWRLNLQIYTLLLIKRCCCYRNLLFLLLRLRLASLRFFRTSLRLFQLVFFHFNFFQRQLYRTTVVNNQTRNRTALSCNLSIRKNFMSFVLIQVELIIPWRRSFILL